jgi:hypothetical protein
MSVPCKIIQVVRSVTRDKSVTPVTESDRLALIGYVTKTTASNLTILASASVSRWFGRMSLFILNFEQVYHFWSINFNSGHWGPYHNSNRWYYKRDTLECIYELLIRLHFDLFVALGLFTPYNASKYYCLNQLSHIDWKHQRQMLTNRDGYKLQTYYYNSVIQCGTITLKTVNISEIEQAVRRHLKIGRRKLCQMLSYYSRTEITNFSQLRDNMEVCLRILPRPKNVELRRATALRRKLEKAMKKQQQQAVLSSGNSR